ncbi:hypothetical protein GHJ82_02940 [Sinorhizobium saheli]|nr:hypothetical protein [Sinorhizobium saheli]
MAGLKPVSGRCFGIAFVLKRPPVMIDWRPFRCLRSCSAECLNCADCVHLDPSPRQNGEKVPAGGRRQMHAYFVRQIVTQPLRQMVRTCLRFWPL